MLYITYTEAVNHLETLVSEFGEDYINRMVPVPNDAPSCVYRDPEDGTPSCGVGHVLARAGFDLSTLTDRENIRSFRSLYEELWEDGKLAMHTETKALLSLFQGKQDNEHTWSHALNVALGGTHAPENDTPPV
jgi:hypothetical protein